MTLSPNAAPQWVAAEEGAAAEAEGAAAVAVVVAEWVVAAAGLEWATAAELAGVAEWEPARLLAAVVVDRLEAAVSPSDRTPLHREAARRLLPVEAITAT